MRPCTHVRIGMEAHTSVTRGLAQRTCGCAARASRRSTSSVPCLRQRLQRAVPSAFFRCIAEKSFSDLDRPHPQHRSMYEADRLERGKSFHSARFTAADPGEPNFAGTSCLLSAVDRAALRRRSQPASSAAPSSAATARCRAASSTTRYA